MAIMLSAKGSDVMLWRAAGEFVETFRQELLGKFEYCRLDEAELLLEQTIKELHNLAEANDAFGHTCERLIATVAACSGPEQLRELTAEFYDALYRHVAIHHSASAFYQASSAFLQALAAAVRRHAENSLGLLSRHIPKSVLIAVGPAGRQEFSPFCPLQLILVHEHVEHPDAEAFSLLGQLIHEGFEASGLRVDREITPRNLQWRGSMAEWRMRLSRQLEQGGVDDFVDLFRLVDQSTLTGDGPAIPEFSELCRSLVQEHHSVMASLVSRVRNISHGIGMLGGLRHQKSGPHRGLFALRDNALQPLSASVCVLALLKGLATHTTPQRIREILWRRELNVDMAERLLQAWHHLHELRLIRESQVQPDWSSESTLYLNVAELPENEQNHLRESLDSVGAIQRHVGLTFSGIEG